MNREQNDFLTFVDVNWNELGKGQEEFCRSESSSENTFTFLMNATLLWYIVHSNDWDDCSLLQISVHNGTQGLKTEGILWRHLFTKHQHNPAKVKRLQIQEVYELWGKSWIYICDRIQASSSTLQNKFTTCFWKYVSWFNKNPRYFKA